MQINEIVQKYIQLRDAKSKLKEEYTAKVEKVDAAMLKIEVAILSHLEQTGADSIGTEFGTAYKATKTSATVSDWDEVLAFIQSNEMWNMLEHRVSKKAVEEFRNENNDLPPGIRWGEEVTVQIRRS